MKKNLTAFLTLFSILFSSVAFGQTPADKSSNKQIASSSNTYPPLEPKSETIWEPWAFSTAMVITAITGILIVNAKRGHTIPR